ncbi:MAG TPA: Imm8 family immunity protein [Polyangiaceae bacterium]|jgi:hypothetical protein|nr:Imm8 family immunity protein [Polyangiaceae bacterium]
MNLLQAAASVTLREQLLLAKASRYPASVSALPDKLGAISAAAAVFRQHGVPYALIGGLAVGVRSGVPRATPGVDFAIPTNVDQRSLTAALQGGGFQLKGQFAHSMNFEHTSGEPVQLAFDAGFDPIIQRAEAMQFGEIELYVVTKDDLIAMKRRAAADPTRRRSRALRDQADIALLEGDVAGTPCWLAEMAASEGPIVGLHHVVVPTFDYAALFTALQSFCSRCQGSTWQEVGAKAGRLGRLGIRRIPRMSTTSNWSDLAFRTPPRSRQQRHQGLRHRAARLVDRLALVLLDEAASSVE